MCSMLQSSSCESAEGWEEVYKGESGEACGCTVAVFGVRGVGLQTQPQSEVESLYGPTAVSC